ncbi:MAG: DUF484 family protein [Syntrophobacterales bacterium]|jgi:uncharacterized protein YigA (DUF484 family)|nr:DUF484 family protein [Syntrophobacterales bacterium]
MSNPQEIKRANDEISKRFQAVEKDLFQCHTVTELCENLLRKMGGEFNIPFVWMTLIDEPSASFLKKELMLSSYLEERLNLIEREAFSEIIGPAIAPVLINTDITPFFRLLPGNTKYFIKSFAICPLTFNRTVMGSINCGDPSSSRYHGDMDTTLLDSLMQKVSARLGYFIA